MDASIKITYTNNVRSLRPEHLRGFFVDWPHHPDPQAHLHILQGSAAVWCAYDEDQCVGFINAISDGVFYAFIPLLEVLPDYQGNGIAIELVKRMIDSLEQMYAIDIICDESIAPFYEKLSFTKCTGMVIRNYHNQDARQK